MMRKLVAHRIKLAGWIVLATLSFFTVSDISVASSFPFREVSPGDALPSVDLTDYTTRTTVSLQNFLGHPLVVLFWGADLPAKKQRSLQALTAVQQLRPFFDQRDVALVIVDAQGDSGAVIDEVIAQAGGGMHVYVDPEQTLYGRLGVFVMPSLLLVSADGKVAAGMGYSEDLAERLRGEVEIMLGEKSRAQIEAELHPKVVEKSAAEKNGLRHRSMGLVLLKRGMPDAAFPEFEEALRFVPDDAVSLVQLGCLSFDRGDAEKAGELLARGLALTPESLPGQLCQARLLAAQGKGEDAIADLQALLLRHAGDPKLHYVLGTLFEELGQSEKAAAEFRKGYELLEKLNRLHQ